MLLSNIEDADVKIALRKLYTVKGFRSLIFNFFPLHCDCSCYCVVNSAMTMTCVCMYVCMYVLGDIRDNNCKFAHFGRNKSIFWGYSRLCEDN